MKYLEAERMFDKMEKEFPIDTLKYKSLNIYPYIRVYLLFQFLKSPEFFKKPDKKSVFKRLLFQFKVLLASFLGLNFLKNLNYKTGLGRKNIDYLFISEDKARNISINNKSIHPFANGIESLLKNYGKYEIVEFVKKTKQKLPIFNDAFILNGLLAKAQIKYLFSKFFKRKKQRIESFEKFKEYLKTLELTLPFSEDELIDKLDLIFFRAKEYESLFKKMHLKTVFFIVSFSDIIFPAILACKKLGIESVELQHGSWSLNVRYNNFPDDGYKLLPSIFWLWGKANESVFANVVKSKNHRTVVGGNPWVSEWLKDDSEIYDIVERNLTEKVFKEGQINVLVSLQPEPDPLPTHLLEAVEKSPENIHWFFRLHPLMLDRKEEVFERVKKIPNSNVVLYYASKLPLFFILKNTDMHVTMWSSVVYEA
ncbi:MAG: hypothetical protein U9R42_01805, partial [Bacteroidota bacterium]|nr:hypothetical protein [Bacteroidota bacterium]